MRIQYKGGVWKNSEDEILKAAVMKYGKNQWARIASLLVRKSAKQCKARWFEWLDPSIKKTQWTREEEEKLLHLAKIMPTSWRTIAPMIGRTAAQCLEHYEKLIDQAQQGADAEGGTGGAGPSSAGGAPSARPRPGEMDPAPESKPARPDPVDMDEDELEMLSEARARLANTKGKKAKRKAREKQLEAAKRLAQLQKRRELKAAGVDLKPRRNNRKQTDYATEVPFERLPVPGFYDTTKEDDIVAAQGLDKKKQLGKLLQKYKGKTEEEKEEEARKKDEEKRKQLEKVNLPAALGYTRTAPTPASPPLKKSRLSLPAPQLSDLQLEKVAKAGLTSGGRTLQPHHTNASGGDDPPAPAGEDAGPPSEARSSTEPWVAIRQRHLETILNLQSTDTPLRGGENTPMVGLGLENGVTPLHSNLTTPNPLASSMSTANDRDATRVFTQAKRDAKRKREKLSEQVMQGLQALPEPENEYTIEADDAALLGLADAPTDVERDTMEEDAEEEERRNEPQYAKDMEMEQRKLLSSAAQKRLPLPSTCSKRMANPESISVLVKRDIEAHTILRALSKSEQTHATALQNLRALGDPEEVEGKYVQTAKKLIEQQLSEQGRAGEQLKRLIFEQLGASS